VPSDNSSAVAGKNSCSSSLQLVKLVLRRAGIRPNPIHFNNAGGGLFLRGHKTLSLLKHRFG
jgi:hypothetical protein